MNYLVSVSYTHLLNKKDGRMHVEHSTVANALQWTNGYLFFDQELLPDVVKELERSYNVKDVYKRQLLLTLNLIL